MRTLIRAVSPVLIALALAACHPQQAQTPAASAQTHVTPPNNPVDAVAWEDYMVKTSHADLQHIASKPYLFEVLAASDPQSPRRNPQIQQALTQMAKSNQFPGNAIAVAGPDPNATADILVASFNQAKPNSLKGLTVLYIGDENDKKRAEKSVADTGAAFRFVAM